MRVPRAMAFAMLCTSALAQLPRPQAPPPAIEEHDRKHRSDDQPVELAQVDVLVTGADGRPVAGLNASDFELTQDDKPRKIPAATYVDGSRGRTLIFVIDDLGLDAAALASARGAVRGFIEARVKPVDRVAIMATSAGTSVQERFSSDPGFLLAALDAIQSLTPEAGRPDTAAARGALCQVRMVIDNLRKESGRKSVVVFSGNLRSAAIEKSIGPSAFTTLTDAAGRSSTVIYDIDPTAPAAQAAGTVPVDPKAVAPLLFATRSQTELQTGLPAVAPQTGGAFFETGDAGKALEQVDRDSQGYYHLTYELDEFHYEFDRVQVRVKREGLAVRTGRAARAEGSYESPREELRRDEALQFSNGALGAAVTPLFEHQPEGSSVDARLHLDLREVAMTENLKGIREARILIAIATLGPTGEPADQTSSTLSLNLAAQNYETAVRNGADLSLRLPLRRTTPGGWQFWVVIRDETTGETGSASRFIEIPNLAGGAPALSSVRLETEGPQSDAWRRTFRLGEILHYSYSLYNLAADKNKRSRIEVRTRLFRNGGQVYEGPGLPLEFDPSDTPHSRSARGTVSLGTTMPPGKYLLQVNVRDTLAPAGKPGTAVGYADFTIRP